MTASTRPTNTLSKPPLSKAELEVLLDLHRNSWQTKGYVRVTELIFYQYGMKSYRNGIGPQSRLEAFYSLVSRNLIAVSGGAEPICMLTVVGQNRAKEFDS